LEKTMIATIQPKTAAHPRPAAVPTGSLPGNEGSNSEIDEADVLAAMGERSRRPTAQPAKKPVESGDDTGLETGTEVDETLTEEEKVAALAAETLEEKVAREEAEAAAGATETEEEKVAREEAEAAAGATETEEEKVAREEAEAAKQAREKGKKPSPAAEARINELTARAKTAEDQASQLRERVASFEAEQSGRFDAGMLEHVDSIEDLAKRRTAIIALRQKLIRSPQGLELTDPADKTKTIQHDAESVAEMLGSTDLMLHEALPAREQFLRARAEFDAAAVNAYPWLKDIRQGPGAQVNSVIAAQPQLRRIGPNYRLVAADALIGQTLREAGVMITPEMVKRLKTEVKKPVGQLRSAVSHLVRKLPPAAPSRPGTIPARRSQRDQGATTADKKMQAGRGSVGDIAGSIAANLHL
jgi:hypothetical protein